MKHVTDQASREDFWRGWLAAHLPAELRERVAGVAAHQGKIVIFAVSAAWSARLRYALAALESDMRAADPALGAVAVRVRPHG